jgi:hypothetical protein
MVRVQDTYYLVGVLPQASSKLRFGVVPPCFLAFPAWLGYDRSQVDLPSLVITALTFLNEILGCSRIFSKSYAGLEAAN